MSNLTDLKNAAEVILYLDGRYTRILPPTTIKLLKSGIKNDNMDKLSLGIHRADLHKDTFLKEIDTDAQIEQLLEEETEIESAKLEAIGLYDFLAEPSHRALIHHSKTVKFISFLAELDQVLSTGSLEEVKTWLKRAKDFKGGIDAKLRRLPMQTERRVA